MEACCVQVANSLCSLFIGRSSLGAKLCGCTCLDAHCNCCWDKGQYDEQDQEEDRAAAEARAQKRREARAAAKAAGKPVMTPSESYAQPSTGAVRDTTKENEKTEHDGSVVTEVGADEQGGAKDTPATDQNHAAKEKTP